MRRLIVVAGILILVGAIGAAYYESTHRFGGSVRGTTTEFVPTLTVAPPQPSKSSIVSPMFAGVPQHLHVGVGKVRPPFRLDWVSGGTSLIEFPPAIGFHYLYYASLNGNLIAVSARNGRRLWTDPVGRCEAAGPALNRLGRGSVYETFLNREPCGRGTAKGEGELLVVAAGPGHALRWRRSMGVTETSPLIVGSRVYVGDYGGRVYCLNSGNGKTLWTYQAGGAVKGAITYDRGRVFFGAYDGRLYALRASDGKLIWRAQSERDWLGAHGQFYSTPSVAYSRVYLGSTDGHVYSFGEKTESCAGHTTPAASCTARRRSGAAASLSVRTTTCSTPSTRRRERSSGSSRRTARSPAPRPSSTASSTSPPSSGARTASTRSPGSRCGRSPTARSRPS